MLWQQKRSCAKSLFMNSWWRIAINVEHFHFKPQEQWIHRWIVGKVYSKKKSWSLGIVYFTVAFLFET